MNLVHRTEIVVADVAVVVDARAVKVVVVTVVFVEVRAARPVVMPAVVVVDVGVGVHADPSWPWQASWKFRNNLVLRQRAV